MHILTYNVFFRYISPKGRSNKRNRPIVTLCIKLIYNHCFLFSCPFDNVPMYLSLCFIRSNKKYIKKSLLYTNIKKYRMYNMYKLCNEKKSVH